MEKAEGDKNRDDARERHHAGTTVFPHLADAGEEVVCNLVVERSRQEGDEGAAVAVVHARLHLFAKSK